MNRIALLALAIVFACYGMPSRAQDEAAPAQAGGAPEDNFTAGMLKDACAPAAALDKNARAIADHICQSYLRGLTEGLFLQSFVEDSGASACLPKDGPISVADAKSDLLNYLADKPDAADRQAGVAGVLAIVRSHGCAAD